MRKFSLFLTIVLGTSLSMAAQASDFVTKWDLSQAGTTGNNSISFFTTNTAGSVAYTWQELSPGSSSGSGSFSAGTAASRSITGLPANAIIELRMAATNLQRFYIYPAADMSRLLDVTQWGTSEWNSMDDMFKYCDFLNITATDLPNLTKVSSMVCAFQYCGSLNGPTNIGSWNTVNVIDMTAVFNGAGTFNQNIGSWNTSNVTSMMAMFHGATAFNQNIGSWNTANVTDMGYLFSDATGFNQNIGSWNTAKVTNMSNMFSYTYFFNQNIGSWNTANVRDMSFMFKDASVFNQNIGSWNTSNVTNMMVMFDGATAFNQNIGNWNTGNVLTMSGMFDYATAFNQNIGNWNTSNVSDMGAMFSNATAFNQNIGNWNTANVKSMQTMFFHATAFNQNIANWNTSNVILMEKLLMEATAFNQNLGNWQINAGVDMTNMLNNSGMDCVNYSHTLAGWANSTTTTGRSLGAIGLTYGTNVSAFRSILTGIRGWTITGDAVASGACGPKAFYSKSTGNLDDLATWGVNTDGTGMAPSNFTGANHMFLIRNRSTASLGAAWSVSGTNSIVIIGDASTAITFSTGSNTISGNFKLTNNATLEIGSNTTGLNLTCENGSAVNYNGNSAQTIATGNYFDLTISNSRGGATLTLASGSIEVRNTYTVSATNVGSWAHTGNTFVYCGSGAQTIALIDYNNLIVSGMRIGTPNITLPSGTIRIFGNAFLSTVGVAWGSPGAINWVNSGNTVEYVGSGGQQIGAYFYNNLTISGNKNSGNFTLEYGDIGAAQTASVTATNISGWTNTGNNFIYNGSSAQTVAPEIVYRNLTIAGSNAKTLGGNTAVEGDLILSSNKLILDAYNLTLSGIVSGASTTNYVQTNGAGALKKNLINTAAFIFPVGNSSYNPATITNNTGTADDFSVRVQDAVYVNGLSGTTLTTPRVDRTWQIGKTSRSASAGSGVDFVLQWDPVQETGGISTYELNHHNGSIWTFANRTGSKTISGTNPKTLTLTQYKGNFSPFAIGHSLSPLRVTGLSFTGERINDRVKLNWSTASEQNSSHFEIERSANGLEFTNIGSVTAAGNSQSVSNYAHWDAQPLNGVTYYRLRQVDLNGAFTFSRVLQLKHDPMIAARIVPTPTNGPINLQIPTDWTGTYDCRVFNTLGIIVENRRALRTGSHVVDLSKNATGLYQFTLWENGKQIQQQWVMKQ